MRAIAYAIVAAAAAASAPAASPFLSLLLPSRLLEGLHVNPGLTHASIVYGEFSKRRSALGHVLIPKHPRPE